MPESGLEKAKAAVRAFAGPPARPPRAADDHSFIGSGLLSVNKGEEQEPRLRRREDSQQR